MDNDVTITLIAGTAILMIVAGFAVSVVLAYQKKYYRDLQKMNTIKEMYELELLKAQLEIKEQTLQNISQEIHDNIGQVLSLSNLQLTAIDLEDNPYAMNKINKSMELVSKAINDLRNLSKALNAEHIAKIGLKKAIECDLELIHKPGKFTTSLQVSGIERPLEFSKEIIVYRIVQESLNNIIKHANASKLGIYLKYMETELLISIADNGKGFIKAGIEKNSKTGAGLQNMVNRAHLIHANLNVESVLSQGTTVMISIPYEFPINQRYEPEN